MYNSYFDEHNVDIILSPGQPTEAVTYSDAANLSVPVGLFPSGETVPRPLGNVISPFVSWFKTVPVPKLMIPVGLDDATGKRPVAVLLWGRGPPTEQMYNDSFARTWDLDFLYKAKAIVEAIHARPELRRVDAPLVSDLFE